MFISSYHFLLFMCNCSNNENIRISILNALMQVIAIQMAVAFI